MEDSLIKNWQIASSDTESEERNIAQHDINVVISWYPNFILGFLEINIREKTLESKPLKCLINLLLERISHCRENDIEIYGPLEQPDRVVFRKQLIQLVDQEQDQAILRQNANIVGQLGASVLVFGAAYPELIAFIFRASMSDNKSQSISALIVLTQLFKHAVESIVQYQHEILVIYKRNLCHDSKDVDVLAIKGLCKLISNTYPSQLIPEFSDMLKMLFNSIRGCVSDRQSPKIKVLEYLASAVEANSHIFIESTDEFYECVSSICTVSDDVEVNLMATDCMTQLVQNSPKGLQTKPEHLEMMKNLISLIFSIPRAASEELTEQFLNPESGFDDQSGYDDFGMKLAAQIERIGDSISIENAESLLLAQILRISNEETDWRVKYGALMSLSQILELKWRSETIKEIVVLCKNFLDNSSHPKIRFAAYHIIGQISDDQKGNIQSENSDVILPLLMAGLDEEVPRLRGHCLAAIINFMDQMDRELAIEFCPKLIPKVIPFIGLKNRSYIIENALSVLSSSAGSAQDHFTEYYDQLMPKLISILENYENLINCKLLGNVAECISFVIEAVGKQKWKPIIPKVVEYFMKIQEEGRIDKDGEIVKYFLRAWHRIVESIDKDIKPYIEKIVPWVINVVNWSPEEGAEEVPQLQASQLECLGAFAGTHGTGFEIYIPQLRDALLGPEQSSLKDVKITKACLMMMIVKCAKDSKMSDEDISSLVSTFVDKLWEVVSNEITSEVCGLAEILAAGKEMIEIADISFIPHDQIAVHCQKINETSAGMSRRRAILSQITQGDYDEETLEEGPNEADQTMESIAEFLGAIMKTHPGNVLEICTYMHDAIIRPILDAFASQIDHKFALFIIADILDLVGPEAIPNEWTSFEYSVLRHIKSYNSPVRQACAYILGIVAKMSTTDFFATRSAQYIETLQIASTLPFPTNASSKGQEQWYNAKENAVSSIHRILRYQSVNVDLPSVLVLFMPQLPLTHDAEEATDCHDWLVEFCEQHHDIMQIYEAKIVEIYTRIWGTEYLASDSEEKVKELLQGYAESGKLTEEIFNSLDEYQVLSLNSILE